MADFKLKYPAVDSVAVTITLASLATNSANAFTSGQESDAIDNRTTLDLDHLVSGRIRTGASPTAGRTIAVYAVAPIRIFSSGGTLEWPDAFEGTNSVENVTSANVLNGLAQRLWSQTVDTTTGRDYWMPPTSVASVFGGVLPPVYALYVAHDTGVALDSNASNHGLYFTRIQTQSV